SFFVRLVWIGGAPGNPGAKTLIVLDGRIQNGNRFECFFVIRVLLQHPLISFDSIARALDVVGRIDAGLVLLVNYSGNENRSGWILRIEIQGALGVLFGFLELSGLVSARRYVEFVLCSAFFVQCAACVC